MAKHKKPKKPIKTLRQVITEELPEAVCIIMSGGIAGCPEDYGILVDHYDCQLCDREGYLQTNEQCTRCWNQKYEEDK